MKTTEEIYNELENPDSEIHYNPKQKWYSEEEFNKLEIMLNKYSKISGIDISEMKNDLFGDEE
jgi:hypothetical protein